MRSPRNDDSASTRVRMVSQYWCDESCRWDQTSVGSAVETVVEGAPYQGEMWSQEGVCHGETKSMQVDTIMAMAREGKQVLGKTKGEEPWRRLVASMVRRTESGGRQDRGQTEAKLAW